MKLEIRVIEYCNITAAMNLIEEVFDEFVPPDYSEQGIKTFKENYIKNNKFLLKFADEREKMYGAYDGDKLVGCLSISLHNVVSCVFVKKEYHRKGIASKLLSTVIEEIKARDMDVIRLNASPYAVPFYHTFGFYDTGEKSNYNGIIYTPMMYVLN